MSDRCSRWHRRIRVCLSWLSLMCVCARLCVRTPLSRQLRLAIEASFRRVTLPRASHTTSTMGLLSTPTSGKKRKVGGRAVETGVDRMLSSGAESDLKYVTRELEDKPDVLAEVARLLRDGELEKAIKRKQTAAIQALLCLGRCAVGDGQRASSGGVETCGSGRGVPGARSPVPQASLLAHRRLHHWRG